MRRLPTVRMTKRGVGMLVFGAATATGGVFLGIPEAAITGMLMAGTAVAMGILTLFISIFSPGFAVRRIVGSPSSNDVRFVGDDVAVDVVLRPSRRTPAGELVEIALDDLAIRRGARSVRLAVRPLRAGEVSTAHYRVTLRQRGTLRFLPGEWRRSDPLGLFWFSRRLNAGSELAVAPAIVDLSADAVARLHALRPHPTRARHAGADPFSLRDLRPHVPGDDLRRVHWATSARRNMLMVRQPETMRTEHIEPAVLLFDARFGSHENTLELALSIAATVVVGLGGQFRATLLTADDAITTTTVHETLLALSGVQREPTRATRTPTAPVNRRRAAAVDTESIVHLVVTGPLSNDWDDTPKAIILRCGLAPLDSSAWVRGAPTREALGIALSTYLLQQPGPGALVTSGTQERR